MRYGLILFSLVSVLGVVAISATVNGRPDLSPYPGWVTVLEPAKQRTRDQVGLLVSALDPGGPGEHPRLVYSVIVCGPDPFRGVLLAGGAAMLSNDPGPAGGASPRSGSTRPSTLARLTLSEGSNNELALGEAQSLKVDMRRPPRCASEFKPDQVLNFFGQAEQIVGRARAPVRRIWSGPLDIWKGPREGTVWPLTGTLPGIPSGEVGVFVGLEGLAGEWKIPVPRQYVVGAGTLNATAAVELARPDLLEQGHLEWKKTTPFAATARVVNESALANWQQALMIATLLFGIGGSVLAALALDATRRRSARRGQRLDEAAADAAGNDSSQALCAVPTVVTTQVRDRGMLPLLIAGGVVFVLERLLRHRRG